MEEALRMADEEEEDPQMRKVEEEVEEQERDAQTELLEEEKGTSRLEEERGSSHSQEKVKVKGETQKAQEGVVLKQEGIDDTIITV